jgi:hypothetical protein
MGRPSFCDVEARRQKKASNVWLCEAGVNQHTGFFVVCRANSPRSTEKTRERQNRKSSIENRQSNGRGGI